MGDDGSGLRVVRSDSGHGCWELVTGRPAPRLAAHVLRYCGYVEATPSRIRRLEVPNGEIVVIIDLGPGWRLAAPDGAAAERHGSFVAGLWDRAVLVDCPGAAHCLQVDLTPTGACRLFGHPLADLTNRAVPLGDLMDSDAERLIDRLHSARGWPARFAILDAVLSARMARPPIAAAAVERAWQRLAAAHGRLGVAALAAEVGWSRKHLTTRFQAELGMAPKLAARVLRFQHALRLASSGRHGGWADIAAACGYSDQAHLSRDFQRFAGSSPTALARRMLPDGGLQGVETR